MFVSKMRPSLLLAALGCVSVAVLAVDITDNDPQPLNECRTFADQNIERVDIDKITGNWFPVLASQEGVSKIECALVKVQNPVGKTLQFKSILNSGHIFVDNLTLNGLTFESTIESIAVREKLTILAVDYQTYFISYLCHHYKDRVDDAQKVKEWYTVYVRQRSQDTDTFVNETSKLIAKMSGKTIPLHRIKQDNCSEVKQQTECRNLTGFEMEPDVNRISGVWYPMMASRDTIRTNCATVTINSTGMESINFTSLLNSGNRIHDNFVVVKDFFESVAVSSQSYERLSVLEVDDKSMVTYLCFMHNRGTENQYINEWFTVYVKNTSDFDDSLRNRTADLINRANDRPVKLSTVKQTECGYVKEAAAKSSLLQAVYGDNKALMTSSCPVWKGKIPDFKAANISGPWYTLLMSQEPERRACTLLDFDIQDNKLTITITKPAGQMIDNLAMNENGSFVGTMFGITEYLTVLSVVEDPDLGQILATHACHTDNVKAYEWLVVYGRLPQRINENFINSTNEKLAKIVGNSCDLKTVDHSNCSAEFLTNATEIFKVQPNIPLNLTGQLNLGPEIVIKEQPEIKDQPEIKEQPELKGQKHAGDDDDAGAPVENITLGAVESIAAINEVSTIATLNLDNETATIAIVPRVENVTFDPVLAENITISEGLVNETIRINGSQETTTHLLLLAEENSTTSTVNYQEISTIVVQESTTKSEETTLKAEQETTTKTEQETTTKTDQDSTTVKNDHESTTKSEQETTSGLINETTTHTQDNETSTLLDNDAIDREHLTHLVFVNDSHAVANDTAPTNPEPIILNKTSTQTSVISETTTNILNDISTTITTTLADLIDTTTTTTVLIDTTALVTTTTQAEVSSTQVLIETSTQAVVNNETSQSNSSSPVLAIQKHEDSDKSATTETTTSGIQNLKRVSDSLNYEDFDSDDEFDGAFDLTTPPADHLDGSARKPADPIDPMNSADPADPLVFDKETTTDNEPTLTVPGSLTLATVTESVKEEVRTTVTEVTSTTTQEVTTSQPTTEQTTTVQPTTTQLTTEQPTTTQPTTTQPTTEQPTTTQPTTEQPTTTQPTTLQETTTLQDTTISVSIQELLNNATTCSEPKSTTITEQPTASLNDIFKISVQPEKTDSTLDVETTLDASTTTPAQFNRLADVMLDSMNQTMPTIHLPLQEVVSSPKPVKGSGRRKDKLGRLKPGGKRRRKPLLGVKPFAKIKPFSALKGLTFDVLFNSESTTTEQLAIEVVTTDAVTSSVTIPIKTAEAVTQPEIVIKEQPEVTEEAEQTTTTEKIEVRSTAKPSTCPSWTGKSLHDVDLNRITGVWFPVLMSIDTNQRKCAIVEFQSNTSEKLEVTLTTESGKKEHENLIRFGEGFIGRGNEQRLTFLSLNTPDSRFGQALVTHTCLDSQPIKDWYTIYVRNNNIDDQFIKTVTEHLKQIAGEAISLSRVNQENCSRDIQDSACRNWKGLTEKIEVNKISGIWYPILTSKDPKQSNCSKADFKPDQSSLTVEITSKSGEKHQKQLSLDGNSYEGITGCGNKEQLTFLTIIQETVGEILVTHTCESSTSNDSRIDEWYVAFIRSIPDQIDSHLLTNITNRVSEIAEQTVKLNVISQDKESVEQPAKCREWRGKSVNDIEKKLPGFWYPVLVSQDPEFHRCAIFDFEVPSPKHLKVTMMHESGQQQTYNLTNRGDLYVAFHPSGIRENAAFLSVSGDGQTIISHACKENTRDNNKPFSDWFVVYVKDMHLVNEAFVSRITEEVRQLADEQIQLSSVKQLNCPRENQIQTQCKAWLGKAIENVTVSRLSDDWYPVLSTRQPDRMECANLNIYQRGKKPKVVQFKTKLNSGQVFYNNLIQNDQTFEIVQESGIYQSVRVLATDYDNTMTVYMCQINNGKQDNIRVTEHYTIYTRNPNFIGDPAVERATEQLKKLAGDLVLNRIEQSNCTRERFDDDECRPLPIFKHIGAWDLKLSSAPYKPFDYSISQLLVGGLDFMRTVEYNGSNVVNEYTSRPIHGGRRHIKILNNRSVVDSYTLLFHNNILIVYDYCFGTRSEVLKVFEKRSNTRSRNNADFFAAVYRIHTSVLARIRYLVDSLRPVSAAPSPTVKPPKPKLPELAGLTDEDLIRFSPKQFIGVWYTKLKNRKVDVEHGHFVAFPRGEHQTMMIKFNGTSIVDNLLLRKVPNSRWFEVSGDDGTRKLVGVVYHKEPFLVLYDVCKATRKEHLFIYEHINYGQCQRHEIGSYTKLLSNIQAPTQAKLSLLITDLNTVDN